MGNVWGPGSFCNLQNMGSKWAILGVKEPCVIGNLQNMGSKCTTLGGPVNTV